MVNKNFFDEMDQLQDEIIAICDNDYEKSKDENQYIAKDDSAYNVKCNILSKLSNEEMKKTKYLDVVAYVLQFGKDVYITIN